LLLPKTIPGALQKSVSVNFLDEGGNYEKEIQNLFEKSDKLLNLSDVNYDNLMSDNEQFYE